MSPDKYPVCGIGLVQRPGKRRPKFCSSRCRLTAHRARHGHHVRADLHDADALAPADDAPAAPAPADDPEPRRGYKPLRDLPPVPACPQHVWDEIAWMKRRGWEETDGVNPYDLPRGAAQADTSPRH
jgi:hypothetical protein